MTSIALTQHGLRNAKRVLSIGLPQIKSSHLTEALAAACGYRTHAALLAQMEREESGDPEFRLIDTKAFISRLSELAGSQAKNADVVVEHLEWNEHNPSSGIIRTRSRKWANIGYRSRRDKAWRNVMVAAINAGIAQKLFTILPGDNRWPGASESSETGRLNIHIYHFSIGDIPAIASVSDAGWDELSIHVALWPAPDAERWIVCGNAGFLAGDVSASSWFERREGAWLQVANDRYFRCRKSRLETVTALDIAPNGFGDRGSFCM